MSLIDLERGRAETKKMENDIRHVYTQLNLSQIVKHTL